MNAYNLYLGVAAGFLVAAAIAIVLILKRVAARQRKLSRQINRIQASRKMYGIGEYRQIEAFNSLQHFLEPVFPLPPMRGWAVSPDFALLLLRLIREHKPKRIVEFGSGTSTLVCAYLMQAMGRGEVIAIDHDSTFAQETSRELARHGLEEHALVHVAALEVSKYIDDSGTPIRWYDNSVIDRLPKDIDFVIIDGPPSVNAAYARYPALPALKTRLALKTVLVIDDTDRPQEKRVLARWQKEFPDISYIYNDAEKGACVLYYSAQAQKKECEHTGTRSA